MNTKRILTAAFAVLATLAIAASDASADSKHGRNKGRGHGRGHDRVVKERVVYAPGPSFTIPHRMAYHDARHYDRYTHRRHWDGHRRAWLDTYYFPVVVRGAVVYRPFSYCNGMMVVPDRVIVNDPYDRYDRYDDRYDDRYYRYDDRVNGYVSFRAPNVSIGIGF